MRWGNRDRFLGMLFMEVMLVVSGPTVLLGSVTGGRLSDKLHDSCSMDYIYMMRSKQSQL